MAFRRHRCTCGIEGMKSIASTSNTMLREREFTNVPPAVVHCWWRMQQQALAAAAPRLQHNQTMCRIRPLKRENANSVLCFGSLLKVLDGSQWSKVGQSKNVCVCVVHAAAGLKALRGRVLDCLEYFELKSVFFCSLSLF